jgi:hypothetical protein
MVKKIFAQSINFDDITGVGWFQTQPASRAPGTLEKFFTNLLGTLTIIGAMTFLIYFVLGAYNYLTAQGDREKVLKAQRFITYAVIGLILIILAWAVIGIIGSILGFDILNLAGLIYTIVPK